jgi:hypothetical protein
VVHGIDGGWTRGGFCDCIYIKRQQSWLKGKTTVAIYSSLLLRFINNSDKEHLEPLETTTHLAIYRTPLPDQPICCSLDSPKLAEEQAHPDNQPPTSTQSSTPSSGDHTAGDQQACNLPHTKSRNDTEAKLIYKWTDADGQTHMSDNCRPMKCAMSKYPVIIDKPYWDTVQD